ncbi:MAG: thermonuclease family protein [Gallionella sp.]|nr:thermonuclease family protein [Gallionella sp.]
MNFFRLLICALLLSAGGRALAAAPQSDASHDFTAKVIVVLDGDTVLVRRGGGTVKIRLAEIDAPEVGHAGMDGQRASLQKAQPFGENSKRSLAGMVLGKQVDVATRAVDQYGRLVAKLSVDGLDVNAEQVRRGMAWATVGWRQNRHSKHPLLALQAEARQARRGLWALDNPVLPGDWRKQHPAAFTEKHRTEAQTPAGMQSGCGKKQYCSEMRSCEEARHYLTQCGIRSLDGNGDGLPCEQLCVRAEE